MRLPRLHKKQEKGFTLVELLIVLAILAVLAAVVIPNVTGMLGRGSKNSFDTDVKTIQTSVAAFYFDPHIQSGTDAGHWYPTLTGATGTGDGAPGAASTLAADVMTGTDGTYRVIYMGLLKNTPAGTVDWSDDGHLTLAELGPYLNEVPQSASSANSALEGKGTYVWTIGASGKVFAFFKNPNLATYNLGFSGNYP